MSKYVVSALKYRPRRFDDVVGQPHIVNTLKSAVQTDQVAHAFLFCGPRGVGKTTCARILARVINCENLQNGADPCGVCAMCTAFDKQASFNIFELDAASHNNVESMRSLVEQVRYQPQHGRYKVYIIDEAHMLTTQAFNAFLKTLEEPPPYAIFILATTEKHKILPTILSRCQIFDFRRITVRDMVAHLEKIAAQEGIVAERDALVTIAQKSDGALRDALSLFDRLASASEKNLTYQSVIQNLNLLDYDMYFQVADACLREDVRDVLLLYDQIVMGGFEGDTFLDGLAAHYRDLLVCRDPKLLALQDHSDELRTRYAKQASLMTAEYIFSALNLINACDLAYPQVRNKRLHVEIGLTRICFLRRLTEGDPFSGEKKTELEKPGNPEERIAQRPDATLPPREDHGNAADHPPEATKPEPANPSSGPASASALPTEKATRRKAPETEVTYPKSTAPPNKGILNTPQLGSLLDVKASIVKAEQIARENSLELTEENALSWWNDFRQTISSPSVAVAFKEAEVSLEDKILKIIVDSQLAKTRINEENDLLIRFRNAFHDHTLELSIIVEESDELKASRQPKKLLTVREKYEKLLIKNPAMEDLKNTLGLIIDRDD